MKLPKLKYYYLALSEDQYQAFEHSRTVAVEPVTINTVTGALEGRPSLTLCARSDLADDLVREHYSHRGAVWILRVPQDLVERQHLRRVQPDVYHYSATLVIPHCGVERWELDPRTAHNATRTIGLATVMQAPSSTQLR